MTLYALCEEKTKDEEKNLLSIVVTVKYVTVKKISIIPITNTDTTYKTRT